MKFEPFITSFENSARNGLIGFPPIFAIAINSELWIDFSQLRY